MTDEQFQIFCDSISHGQSIKKALLSINTAWTTLNKYLIEKGDPAESLFARARASFLEYTLTERKEILDRWEKKILAYPQCANALANMCKQETGGLEWELSIRLPRKFGSRIQVDAELSHRVVRLPAKKGAV